MHDVLTRVGAPPSPCRYSGLLAIRMLYAPLKESAKAAFLIRDHAVCSLGGVWHAARVQFACEGQLTCTNVTLRCERPS